MRIIHTADWHLGRLFHGVNLLDDQACILDDFIRLVKDSKPDVVLIAGDVYDRSVPPADAVKLLSETLTAVCLGHKIPAIVISGNHDNAERLGFASDILKNQGLFMIGPLNESFQPVILEDKFGPVYFCPIPYCEPAFARSFTGDEGIREHDGAMAVLAEKITVQVPERMRKVALAHAFVRGGTECESERPLTVVGGAGTVDAGRFYNFNYTALGHLHRPQNIGGENIHYAGSILKYSFSEADHKKSVTIIELDQEGEISHFEKISLNCCRDVRIIDGYMDDLLKGSPDGLGNNDYIKVVLRDQGALLDPLGKLRSIYPNLLDIERPRPALTPALCRPGADFRQMSDLELYSSFFDQVSGEPLNDEERKEFTALLEEFYTQERR